MADKSSGLTLAKLQSLAVRCGITKSGTKRAIIGQLSDAIHQHKPVPRSARVLSIDLGIRNLAYSLLSPEAVHSTREMSLLTVQAWQRLALTSSPASTTTRPKKKTRQPSPREDCLFITDNKAADPSPAKTTTEDFTPLALSALTVRLVRDRLLPLRPTHVLIERQRHRSMGGAAVLEWTVRVNTLEAMLYAVFASLKDLGVWDGVLMPVVPRRVGNFLLLAETTSVSSSSSSSSVSSREKTTAATKKKQEKIDLLGRWLAEGKTVQLGNEEVRSMADAFLQRWQGGRSGKMRKTDDRENEWVADLLGAGDEGLTKLDDLADSLLQGIAWMRWQENTGLLARNDDGVSLLQHRIKQGKEMASTNSHVAKEAKNQ